MIIPHQPNPLINPSLPIWGTLTLTSPKLHPSQDSALPNPYHLSLTMTPPTLTYTSARPVQAESYPLPPVPRQGPRRKGMPDDHETG